jgi:hypothetical protein
MDNRPATDRQKPEDLSKITRALANPKWDFRTIPGIAKETDLGVKEVEGLLKENPDLFRKLPITDKLGRDLFAPNSRPVRWREHLAILQRALSGKLCSS